jgi:hypothetical protein
MRFSSLLISGVAAIALPQPDDMKFGLILDVIDPAFYKKDEPCVVCSIVAFRFDC